MLMNYPSLRQLIEEAQASQEEKYSPDYVDRMAATSRVPVSPPTPDAVPSPPVPPPPQKGEFAFSSTEGTSAADPSGYRYWTPAIERMLPSLVAQAAFDRKQENARHSQYQDAESSMVASILGAINKATEGAPSIAKSGQESLARLIPSWSAMFAAKPMQRGGVYTPTGETSSISTQPEPSRVGYGVDSQQYAELKKQADAKGLTGQQAIDWINTERARLKGQISGAQSTATVTGRNATSVPLSPEQANRAGLPVGSTIGDMGGKVPTNPAQRTAANELQVSSDLLERFGTMSDQLITATKGSNPFSTGLSTILQAGSLYGGAMTGHNELAKTYRDTRQALLGVLSRQIAAEKGVLTDRDIIRIDNALPQFTDTVGIKNQKMALLRGMVQTSREARVKAMQGIVGGFTPLQSGGGSGLSGQRTSKPDGTYEIGGQRYTVRNGVIQ